MVIPAIQYLSWASQGFPALAGVRDRGRIPPARRWIIAWGLIGLSLDAVSLWLALRQQNNHWVSYLAAPLEVSTLLLALSCWQPSVAGRRVLCSAAIAFVAADVLLVGSVENVKTFSLLRGPIESILIVVASLATLLVLIRQEQGSLLQRDWFWICAGLALRYGAGAALDPLGRVLVGNSPEVVASVLNVKAVVNVVSNLLIARGVWCPILPQRSYGPSPPVSSPSLSSSPPSARGS